MASEASSPSPSPPADKPHAICIPWPFQSHINSMLQLAKLLHRRGFHITFVNTEFNQNRFLSSKSDNLQLQDYPADFRFETIPDGIPPLSDLNSNQDLPALCNSTRHKFLAPFTDLIAKLNDASSSNVPPVSCIVSDVTLPFTVTAAEILGGIPLVLLCTIPACSFMITTQFPALIEKGLFPIQEESLAEDGFLDRVIDWFPGMNDMRIRHLGSMLLMTNPEDWLIDFLVDISEKSSKADAVVFHTFDALEQQVLDAYTPMFPKGVYGIGPLQLLLNQQIQEEAAKDGPSSTRYSLWKEEDECLQWLDSKEPNSVVYVNFGSVVSIKKEQLIEFGMGLANTNHPFLWVSRPNMIIGESGCGLPQEILEETTKGRRGFIANWCPQEKVLNHPSIACFVTHSGWSSTIESISAGVPMICWPQAGDQATNCKYTCNEWGIGMEINEDVKREDAERVVREVMEGEKGMKMKETAMKWKKLAEEAAGPNGSSSNNLDRLVKQVLCRKEFAK